MKLHPILFASCVALALAACGGTVEAPGPDVNASASAVERGSGVSTNNSGSVSTSSATGDDDGTALSATCAAGAPQCTSQEGADVALTGTVSTTGSVDSVDITASVDGATAAVVGTIQPQDFTHDGRNKTASYSVTVSLTNGTHTVQLCFVQSGAQGRTPKSTCAAPVTVTVACQPQNTCAGIGFFGDLVGNHSLCTGNGPPHIPVHVKGDLGEEPSLSISGPNHYSFQATMRHAGESCVYQYNWDTAGNGGKGTYTFTVTGNGNTFTFNADLKCK